MQITSVSEPIRKICAICVRLNNNVGSYLLHVPSDNRFFPYFLDDNIKIQLKRVFTPIIWIIAKKCLFLHSNEYLFAFIAENSISIIKKP